MPPVPPTELSDKEKLEILQRFDRFRGWRSLDDKRYCLVCAKIITGREIKVICGTADSGLLRVVCPTPDCNSIPLDWVLPTGEVLAKFASESCEQRPAVAEEADSAGQRTQRDGEHRDPR
jgi:hypothetical protein